MNFDIKNLLKYIPGYRSNTKWKKVIASVYCLFSVLMLFGGFGYFIFFMAAPFMVFSAVNLFKRKSKISALIMVLAIIVMGIGIGNSPESDKTKPVISKNIVASTNTKNKKKEVKKQNTSVKSISNSTKVSTGTNVKGELKISYINVGQGDSELIQQGDKNMLIDTGTNASTSSLISYLHSKNIKKLDYLVLTHPHEDHIGGADAVINDFDIGTVYMNKVTTTTKTFKDVVTAMQSKGIKATIPVPGDSFKLGQANCSILGPINSNPEDLNTYSIVVKITFGNNKFLFTGDAQTSNEQDMINRGYDLSADVLKVGHHGSYTSTSQEFLDKVNPKYAVISVGINNEYHHPHKSTMDRLQTKGIKVYRTDECGTIVCTSNGKAISFDCNPGDYKYNGAGSSISNSSTRSYKSGTATSVVQTNQASSANNKDRIVYWTPKGKSYHFDKNCRTLSRSKTILSGPLSKCPKSDPCNECVH